jgi:hypothetical protein
MINVMDKSIFHLCHKEEIIHLQLVMYIFQFPRDKTGDMDLDWRIEFMWSL